MPEKITIINLIVGILFFLTNSCSQIGINPGGGKELKSVPEHPIPFNIKKYICLQAEEALNIDGKAEEEAWNRAEWTDPFVDIEGDIQDKPTYQTWVKMLWDDHYLYFLANLNDPHIWANIKKRDAVIFHDNDFEIFIDPDSDTHHYAEIEINALNTIWDLLLTKPYRDGGISMTNWDMNGIKTAVYIQGTLNNANDKDQSWNAEIAIPWTALNGVTSGGARPSENEQWRINFSRVQWKTIIEDNGYSKKRNESGKILPEQNWVWSPQGRINMHRPETWGIVQFNEKPAGSKQVEFKNRKGYSVQWYLRNLYYRQKQFWRENGTYASQLKQLKPESLPELPVEAKTEISSGDYWYVITVTSEINKKWFIREDGKTWRR